MAKGMENESNPKSKRLARSMFIPKRENSILRDLDMKFN
jgi:hypothetical protein